jgi:hypothetical protein
MSVFYYIGADKELTLGERGSKRIDKSSIKDSQIEEYETLEDAAGIYLEDIKKTGIESIEDLAQ